MRQLDLAQAPPISVPLRFFLTAPVFAVGAAVLALWHGGDAFASRWTPQTLALTHLLALGCLTMVMIGALMQVVPVLAGAPIARPRTIAAIVHPALAIGTVGLAAAFLSGEPALFVAAAIALAVAFVVFVAAMLHALWRTATKDATVHALQLAAIALAVTVVLGVCLALHRALGIALPVASLSDLHPGWALFGWIGLLVTAVARRVVPMFQLTPAYPAWLSRRFGYLVVAALVAWSVANELGHRIASLVAAVALGALYIAFAVTTLVLQRRRRRRQSDVNLLFWRMGMVFAIAAALAFVASDAGALPYGIAMTIGVLAIAGAALSLVNGMLYRIVPFLAWFHLYTLAGASPYVPNLKDYLAETRQRGQLWLHAAALVLLVGAAWSPHLLARAGALLFVLSALFWQANLVAMVRVYLRHARALRKSGSEMHFPTSVGVGAHRSEMHL